MSDQFLCSDCGRDTRIQGKHICDACREVRNLLASGDNAEAIIIGVYIKHHQQHVLRQHGFTVLLEDDE